MLQSYATMRILDEMEYDYELLRYKKKYTPLFILKSLPRVFNPITINDKKLLIQKKLLMLFHSDIKKLNNARNKKFEEFRNNNFKNYGDVAHGYKELVEIGNKYDGYMVGSDQLWSPSGLATKFYNLMFVDKGKIKISYASSFGVKVIPKYQEKRTKKYLERIQYISTREISGQKIVKDLIKKDVPVVLDPTLLLDSNKWDEILKKENIIKMPYIFAYFLGTNSEHRKRVQELSQKTGLKIVTIRHMDQYVESDNEFGDIAPYEVGPTEFVNLIRYAEFVCTDSFHGSVFSIINHKKFLIFNRYSNDSRVSKNSRIDSLCTNLNIQDRRYVNQDIYEAIDKEIDYVKIDEIVDKMRNDSKMYLKNALSKIVDSSSI
jgi:hypothetical protein